MISTYLNQLSALGIPPEKLPADELKTRIESGEPSFMINVQPYDDPNYLVTLYYITLHETKTFFLRQFVGTQYDPVSHIDKSHPVLVGGAVDFSVRNVRNLLAGRCVARSHRQHTLFGYDRWYHLDFHTPDVKNAFRLVTTRFGVHHYLEKVLALYPIIELQDPVLRPIIMDALAAGEEIQIQLLEGKKINPKLIRLHPAGRMRFNRPDKASATFHILQRKAEIICPQEKTPETSA